MSNLSIDTITIDLTNAFMAWSSIDTIDNAIDTVNFVRAGYGVVQNRIDSPIRNMVTYVESLSVKSQIMDADYAHETAEMTRLQVMQQAGTALLQARTINQS